MTEHTPGPWIYTKGVGFKHYVASENGDLDFSLQELHWRDGREVPAEANARLIAAAPELLEACKEALVKCPFPVGAALFRERLQTIVAKAEGKDS